MSRWTARLFAAALGSAVVAGGVLALSTEPRRQAARFAARRSARWAALWLDGRVEGFFEPNSPLYARIFAPALSPLYNRAADDVAVELASRGRGQAAILDLGCGPGDLAVRLASRLQAARIVGLDLSPTMIELAKRHETPGGGLRFVVGDAASLPFEADSFDVVVSTLSLHHWAEPAASFAEIRRVLRPGGLALVYDLRLLTIESTALPAVTRKAGLEPGELRRERLVGGPAASLFARFRLEVPEIPAEPA